MGFYYLVYRGEGIPEGIPEVLKLLFVWPETQVEKMMGKMIRVKVSYRLPSWQSN